MCIWWVIQEMSPNVQTLVIKLRSECCTQPKKCIRLCATFTPQFGTQHGPYYDMIYHNMKLHTALQYLRHDIRPQIRLSTHIRSIFFGDIFIFKQAPGSDIKTTLLHVNLSIAITLIDPGQPQINSPLSAFSGNDVNHGCWSVLV